MSASLCEGFWIKSYCLPTNCMEEKVLLFEKEHQTGQLRTEAILYENYLDSLIMLGHHSQCSRPGLTNYTSNVFLNHQIWVKYLSTSRISKFIFLSKVLYIQSYIDNSIVSLKKISYIHGNKYILQHNNADVTSHK